MGENKNHNESQNNDKDPRERSGQPNGLPPWINDLVNGMFGGATKPDSSHTKGSDTKHETASDGDGVRKPPRRPTVVSKWGGLPKYLKISPMTVTIAVLLLIVGGVYIMSHVWTEGLWYAQLGAISVFIKQWGYFILFGFIGFLLVAFSIAINLVVAYKGTKKLKHTATADNLVEYRRQLHPMRKLIAWVIPIAGGVFIGVGFAAEWQTILLALNAPSFGQKDPQFGYDISFFVFTVPALRAILFLLAVMVGAGLVIALAVNYLYGGIRLISGGKPHFSVPARRHVAILASIGSVLVAGYHWINAFGLLLGKNDKFSGASYTNVNADLPAQYILAGISLVVALLFVVTAVKGTWILPTVAVSIMAVSGLVVGVAYPTIVQKFQVDPNAISMESKFIQRNINATLDAYGLKNVKKQTYTAKTQVARGQLREDSDSTASIRILDPNVVAPSFNQLQQNRQYYAFEKYLSVDRYNLEGENHDSVIAVRELNLEGLGKEQRTWVNDHTVYTHGFGVVAGYGNKVQADGRPDFFEQGIPSSGKLGKYEPRVYFGQRSPSYSIVGAPAGTEPMELDYPDDKAPNGQVNTTYTGNGGPSLGNWWNRLLYAIKFRSSEILFTDRVNEKSQILYYRDPQQRVAKVAPYLTIDNRVYPAVVDMDGDPNTPKRLVWIVDAYTTTDQYPYSAHASLLDATEDSRLGDKAKVRGALNEINYINNSVKAVVDAYDGKVTLYKWGDKTPILDAWTKIYPGYVKPTSAIPADLLKHLRYPEDLFKVQRTLLSRYHVTDAASFYSGGDFWKLPDDPTKRDASVRVIDRSGNTLKKNEPQPPYYLTMQMPGQKKATFSLTSTYIPGGNTDRNVLTGFIAVDAEAATADGKVNPNYGEIRLLELPRDITVPGPGQVQNNFDSSPTVSTQLNLLRTGGSGILFGNQLTIPMGGGLLYVEPVYIQSTGGTSYPLLRYVLTAFGDSIGFAPTLDESLDQLFGGDSGAKAGDADQKGNATPKPSTEDGKAAPAVPANEAITAALAEAKAAMEQANAAMKAGDWAAYGKAQERLTKALQKAVAADQQARTAKPQN